MESASAVPPPEASTALPEPEVHAVPTSDGTEVRLTRYRDGDEGPASCSRPATATPRARSRSTRSPRASSSTWASTATTSGCSITARAPTCPRATASSRSTTSRCATGRRRSTPSGARPAPTRCRRWATASAACRSSWPSAAAWRACARPPSRPSPATRSRRRATSCAPASAWRPCSSALGIKGLEHRLRPEVDARPRGRAVMKALPFRHVYDDPVARRIYFIYGDVFDYENIDEETMRSSVPSFFGNGNITFFEHISLMIRAREARNARGEDVYVSNLDAYQLPINFMTGEHNRMFVPEGSRSAPTTRCARRNGPERYTPHGLQGLRPPRLLAGHATPNATSSRPPSPSWSATTDEHHRRRLAGQRRRAHHPGCATSSTTRSWRPCRTAARGAWPRACRCSPARRPTRAPTSPRR